MIGAGAGGRARWLAGAAAVGLVVIATIVGTLMALLGASLPCVGGGSGVALAGGPANRAVHRDFPPARIAIFQAAGRRFDIDWTFVASIAFQECGARIGCTGASPSGCAGPMAIASVRESACSPGPGPTLWERYGLDIDGDGVANVNDPVDAIFSAAHIMRVVMHAPRAGGSYAGYREAACHYYGACADSIVDYAEEVMARAVEYGFGAERAPLPVGGGEAVMVGSGSGSSCGGTETSGGGASGREIVRIAQSQLGQGESPPGSNCTRYGPCEQWCSLFLAWVWEHAGVPLRGGTAPYAYSGSIYEWAAAHESRPRLGHEPPGPGEAPFSTPESNGARVLPPSATPEPGDAVLYGSGPTASDHIGIVERVFPDGEITTIDGNYGDRVARVGPFFPSQAVSSGEPAPIFGYAHPGSGRTLKGWGPVLEHVRLLLERPLDPSLARAVLALAAAALVGYAAVIAVAGVSISGSGSARPPVHRPAPSRGDGPSGSPRRTRPRQDPQDDPGSAAGRRAHRELHEHAALQNVPYRRGGFSVLLVGAGGGQAVLRVSAPTLMLARVGWRSFLRRFADSGRTYLPRFQRSGGRG